MNIDEKQIGAPSQSTNSITATRVKSLSPERAELLKLLEQKKRQAAARQKSAEGRIFPREAQSAAPVSFAQRRLWLADQAGPAVPLYNEHAAFCITGNLDVEVLKQCVNEVILRHEVLRTEFVWKDSGLQTRCVTECEVSIPFVDLSHLGGSARREDLVRLANDESQHRFDLGCAPLLRLKAVKTAAQEHFLLVTMHHLVCDGWSLAVFIREMNSLYADAAAGHSAPLPVLGIQYSDFASWQQERMEEIKSQQLGYWTSALKDAPFSLELPTDFPRSRVVNYTGAFETVSLGHKLTDKVREFSRTQGLTPFVTLLAALKVLIHRYSGQDDLVVSVPVAGRNHIDVEPLIGFFVNVLALRTRITGEESFVDIVQRTGKAAVEAYSHQDLPFEMLLQESIWSRNGNGAPLFDIFFNYANTPPQAIHLGGATVERVELAQPIAKCPITFYVDSLEKVIRIRLLYQTELFNAATLQLLLKQYSCLLAWVMASPRSPVRTHSLLTDICRSLLPDPAQPMIAETQPTVCELFLAQAMRTPDHAAIVAKGRIWNYQELASRAILISRMLRNKGLGKHDIVAMIGRRSPEFIAAMLGVFLNGTVVLPVDESLPQLRKKLMVQQVKAKAVLWLGSVEDGIVEGAAQLGLVAEQDSPYICQDIASAAAECEVRADDPAYVFFTSGTTGMPKAVLGQHQGLGHFLQWQKNTFAVGPDDRCAQLIGLSFDVVLRDILLPLVSGASLHLPDDTDDLGADSVLTWLREEKITSIHTTPSIAASWLRSSSTAHSGSLRLVFFAGEPLPASTIDRWRSRLSFTGEFVNLYGPTETTLAKCFYRVPASGELPPILPVGRTLPQTQALVVGKNDVLCGMNEIGEIVLRTPFRSLGYLNAGAEENSRFRVNPFTAHQNDLIYHTGDKGRYRPDGTLEIIGRMDDQIKVRGIRIEPSEITAVILQHPEINTCAVVSRKNEEGDNQLIAYVVKQSGRTITEAELKRYLSQRLPGALVPAAVVSLQQLPLTANGKLDRRALPVPEIAEEQQEHVAPRTPEEEKLEMIFQRVLKTPRVGVTKSFFELGGNSLLAMELMAEVRKVFHTQTPLKQLFETPTVEGLAEMLALQGGQVGVSDDPPVAFKVDKERRYEPFPLTDIQQAYWVGRSSSFDLGNVATHSYSEFQFENLDLQRFKDAFCRLVQRHDMLRAIVTSEGEQCILKEIPDHQIPVHDLRGKSSQEAGQELNSIRQQLSHQVLPLDRWPLFEIAVSVIDDVSSIVHLSMDALICDAWSRRILGRELLHLYRTPEVPLPPLEISFRDYVMTEVSLRGQELYRKSEEYWLGRLATLPPSPELPLVKSPGSLAHPRFARIRFRLEAQAWQQLKTQAARRGITPSGVICAAYAELLAMWSKNPDFTINLTLFNRLPLHPQVNEIIGDFTSLVLVGVHSTPSSTFEDRSRQVQKQLWDDLDHRYFSGVRALREMNRKQGGAGRALMPIVLTSALFGGASGNDELVQAWQKDMSYGISQTPQVYLDHGVSEQGGALVVTWDYIEELFPEGMMKEMFGGYERLLRALAEDENSWQAVRFDALLITEQLEQRSRINATNAPVPCGLLHQGFIEQAQRRPEATAVISSGRRITYQQLLVEANHIAVVLRERGAERNQLVAVVMEKGWEQVVAVMGILQSGAAYLPIEAGLPRARREQLLEQGKARIVLTQPWLKDKLEWRESVEVVPVEAQGVEKPAVEVGSPAGPEDLAYVIFTSGSTGVPKGVKIDHRAALNTVVDINERFQVTEQDRVLGLSSLSFDLSVYDVFGVLGAGGAVVLPGAESNRDPEQWLRLLQQEQVTVWNSVPALLEMLVEYSEGAGQRWPESLRLGMLSGDWIPLTLAERAWKLQPGLKLMSLGGATEAAIWSILYPIEEVREEWKSIPYGRPMKNQSFQVLHENHSACPVWVPGQLYIGGVGLAQGYWGDEEKTRQRFVEHQVTGERLYLTGDLGRYLPDGNIEFLGREDQQVKVQGHRIETGEIEAVLEQHPGVRQAVVTAVGALRGPKKLVAYVVPRQECELQTDAFKSFLAAKLPAYMVPATIHLKDSMPLSANGKVDRSAFLKDLAPEEETRATLAPRTRTEEQIAELWRETLGSSPASITENFFNAGGDSVSAIKLLSKVKKAFNADINVREFFERSSIMELAEAAEKRKQIGPRKDSDSAITDSDEHVLSFAQERLWFLCQLEPESPFYNLPIAVHLKGKLNMTAFRESMDEIVTRHEILRTGFPSVRGKIAPFIVQRAAMPLRMIMSGPNQQEVAQAIENEVRRIFDLSVPPLCRAAMLDVSDEEHILVLTIHHMISDARSLEVLIQELSLLYESRCAGTPSALAGLEFQYEDFSRSQRAKLKNGEMRQQLSYWKERLGGALPALNLPYDSPAQSGQSRVLKGARERFHLPADLSTALSSMAQSQGITLFMLLLAAFDVLVSASTGQEDIIVSTSVSNRGGADTEFLVGLFLNTVLMRTKLLPQVTFKQLLDQIRQVALDAYAHQDVPFEELVKVVLPDRKLNNAPITPVAFGFRNSPPATERLGDLEITPLEINLGTAKFDWELQLVKREEGIHGFLEYNSDRFRSSTIQHILKNYLRILEEVTAKPELTLGKLMGTLTRPPSGSNGSLKSLRPSFSSVKPRPVSQRSLEQVNVTSLPGANGLPLAVLPKVSIDLSTWLKTNQKFVEDSLHQHGGVLFRNFTVPSGHAFENVISQSHELLEYVERSTPRRQVNGRIYTSTEYPPDQSIPMHNENSYSHTWPMKIWFFCDQAAASGGETPIADSRKIYQAIDPDLRERFARKQVMYVRNFNNGLGLRWQEAFQTEEKTVVENYCRKHGIKYEWPSAEHLRTYQTRQGVAKHPVTGQMLWFNQAHLFHVNSLPENTRNSLMAVFKEEDLPRNAYFGDGTPILQEELDHIRQTYEAHAVLFPWQQGDLLMLDNMLVAHGRMPFSGPRRILVAMAQPATLQ
jgi:amino acid adenylation domain-containing protein